MHYGEVEKWGETLTNYFSSDFHHEFVKFCTNLSELLKNNGIIFWLKKLRKNGVKRKKAVGGVFSSQDWSQKKPLAKIIFFLEKSTF